MTELAYPYEELEDFQELRRRGPKEAFWDHRRLRRPARVAINAVAEKPKISVLLRQIRDSINTNGRVGELPEAEPKAEEDPMAVALPPQEKLRLLGSAACEAPSLPRE
ncbi:MAG TPA: hypothetical protein VFP32_02775 [Candidatus Saccharimonadales bacterium]|nr:hypothetical protein [Candidatus Saccharimonadales bacterium]